MILGVVDSDANAAVGVGKGYKIIVRFWAAQNDRQCQDSQDREDHQDPAQQSTIRNELTKSRFKKFHVVIFILLQVRQVNPALPAWGWFAGVPG